MAVAVVRASSPRTLSLANALTGRALRDLPFSAVVRRVDVGQSVLCVLTAEGRLHVFRLATLKLAWELESEGPAKEEAKATLLAFCKSPPPARHSVPGCGGGARSRGVASGEREREREKGLGRQREMGRERGRERERGGT